ncbi:MAG: type VI secretion system protein, partial [Candidatus Acidiferrum sp.]
MNLYAAVAVIFVVYLALVYRLCSFLRLSGVQYWVLLGSLAFIGALAIAAFVWFRERKSKTRTAGESATQTGADSNQDLELLFKEADSRLAASQLGSGAKLGTLPVFFVIGTSGSTKTTTMVQSGLEAELLSGQVYQENNVAPTRLANLWFARNTIFVEAAGNILDDPSHWDRLVRRLRPGRLVSVGKRAQAPRAALVCFDSENFLKAGAADAVIADARRLHARLNEISQRLGISFPVYALFTKLDRLAFFLDYVRNLNDEEASQVLGATLPPLRVDGKQIYTDAQRARLTEAFDDLYYSLCSKRPEFLFREHDADKLPGVYEFAREFRKIRTPLVQFLVDLCRPSQLATAPFLRGFYFTGVRPVVTTEAVAAPVQRSPERSSMQGTSGATGMFRVGQQQAEAARPAAVLQRESRRVPQWVFLKHLFTNVLLADGAALGASGSSTKVSALRRGLLAAA